MVAVASQCRLLGSVRTALQAAPPMQWVTFLAHETDDIGFTEAPSALASSLRFGHGAPRMRAAIYTRYGGPEVVQIAELVAPVPRRGEVLIRVLATTVPSGDVRPCAMRLPRRMGFLERLAFGLTRPRKRLLGSELVGVVTAIGPGVTRGSPGDAVIGFPGVRSGAHAEACVMREGAAIIPRPAHFGGGRSGADAGRAAQRGAARPARHGRHRIGASHRPGHAGRALNARPVLASDRQHLCAGPDRRRTYPRRQRPQTRVGHRDVCPSGGIAICQRRTRRQAHCVHRLGWPEP